MDIQSIFLYLKFPFLHTFCKSYFVCWICRKFKPFETINLECSSPCSVLRQSFHFYIVESYLIVQNI